MKYLLDTNTLIYAQKRQGQCLTRIEAQPPETLAWSVINLQELCFGIGKSSHPQRMLSYVAVLKRLYTLLPYTPACAEQAGKLRAQLEQKGTPIGPFDLQIAASALAHKLTVVTRNTRGFERIPGLCIENWYD